MLGVFLCGVFLICSVFYLSSCDRRYGGLPPPRPLLGHFPRLAAGNGLADPVNRIWELYKAHSRKGLLYIRMFNFPMVYIGDFATLKQVFNHPDAQGRSLPRMREVFKEQRRSTFLPGIIFSPVEAWSELRRFTLRALKDFGFGQTGMESIIVEELAQFTLHMRRFIGQPTDIRTVFMLPLINILWRVMSSQQFEYDNPQMIQLMKNVSYLFQYDSSAEFKVSLAWPWLAKLGPVRKLLKKDEWLAVNHKLLDMMSKSIEDHEKTMDMDAPRDFIDMVLIEIG